MPTVPRGFSGTAGSKFAVIVRGQRNVALAFTKYFNRTNTKLYDAIVRSMLMVEAESKKLMTYAYYRPAVDTGRLRASTTGKIVNYDKRYIEAKVGTNVYYGIYVHEGTYFMKKRPYLVDALRNKSEQISDMIKKAVKADFNV